MNNFSESQKEVFEKYLKDENIFITGPGGSGKSYLIKCIYQDAIEKCKNIKICALTGCASILLGCKATTLHRFAGIGLANKSIDEVVSYVFKNKYKLKAWYSLNTLIIDEVSMMSLKLLIILDKIARRIYNRPKIPFGGLQVIFSGDFYQLPPVNSNGEEKESGMFCFEHELWNEIFPKENQIVLKTIFRQEEENFLKILRYVRKGKITESTKKMLEDKIYTEEELDKIREEKVVTIINPYRKDTDYINNKYYNELPKDAEKNIYNLRYLKLGSKNQNIDDVLSRVDLGDDSTSYEYDFMANNIMADKSIELKVGTYVMCIANIALECDNPIVNGSQGIVVGFKNGLPLVKFNNIKEPLIVDYYTWISEKNKKIGVGQIPLIYAWAITIHKSQGVTLSDAIMDIGKKIFEYGQTYVALSRVKSLDGLYLTNFDYTKIIANPKVKKFYGDI
tara:strand:- start:755 stop:2104 length:1350 start_codon:yes stop_codon:yes gene_type:complete